MFFGAVQADASSTAESLLASETFCDQQLDHSSYWAPALLDRGDVVQPDKVTAYYRPGHGIDPTTVEPYPLGLKMIAGTAHSGPRPSTKVASWTCGVSPRNEPSPPDCPPDSGLRMIVTFPDCWDGTNLDSPDHRSHVVYSTGGACPPTHPVAVPQLTATLAYLITGSGHELSLDISASRPRSMKGSYSVPTGSSRSPLIACDSPSAESMMNRFISAMPSSRC